MIKVVGLPKAFWNDNQARNLGAIPIFYANDHFLVRYAVVLLLAHNSQTKALSALCGILGERSSVVLIQVEKFINIVSEADSASCVAPLPLLATRPYSAGQS